jgi:hypothetical protein
MVNATVTITIIDTRTQRVFFMVAGFTAARYNPGLLCIMPPSVMMVVAVM